MLMIHSCVNKRFLNTVVDAFNQVHPRIQFTLEIENDGKLTFLDTEIHRTSDGTLETRWDTKPTWSGRYINFHSQLPIAYKRNTVSLLTRKVLELSATRFHIENKKKNVSCTEKEWLPFKFYSNNNGKHYYEIQF